MQYGSIGWSDGAILGYAMGAGSQRRVIGFVGDGAFQLTAQEVSTMIPNGMNPIVFLINNGGYTIEVEIHTAPTTTFRTRITPSSSRCSTAQMEVVGAAR